MVNLKQLKVTLVRSRFGRLPLHAKTMKGLGLKKIGQQVLLQDTPSIRGMVNQVHYLLKVEEL
ncbi:MAG: 50S ribosomal protein L30 [Legionellaceae bacterium]